MELKDLFTYHTESRALYKKFLKVFKLAVDTSSRNSIVFINEDTQVEIEFYFINRWIKYSIRYYNKNKDRMSYVYNYFWNRKDQTEFYFIGGDSDNIDYYIEKYVNSHWFCVSLLNFCSVLCSREVADVIGTNYFIDKYDELDEEKKSVEKIILKNIGGKYMFCVNVLGNSTVNELKQLGYYNIEDSDKVMIFEHEKNKSYIIIKQDNGNYVLNFKNNNNNKFLKSDWYLGNKDGVCCTDIFTIIEKPEFKKFCKCEQQEVIDENEDTSQETLLTKFRKFEHIDKLIKSHTSFIITEDEPNIFIIHDGNYNMNIQVQVEENDIQVYVYDEKGEELGSETLGNINSLDNTIFNFAIFYERTYQDIRKERFDKAMEQDKQTEIKTKTEENKSMPVGFENVRIHEGKLETTTQKQIKDICDSLSDLLVYKNQKYGNSALEPKNIFYKGNAETSIMIRLDDKLGRIINNTDGIRVNDVCDIIGYLVLYLVFKNVSKADIEKLKD